MTNLPTSFTLRLVSGCDLSIDATDCIDVVEVKGEGTPLFHVSFEYEGDQAIMRVKNLSDITPEMLPFIASGIHFGGVVYERCLDITGEGGHEFLAEAFVDDDGNSIEHPIDFGIAQAIPSVTGM